MTVKRDASLFLTGSLLTDTGTFVSMTLIGYAIVSATGSSFLVGLQSLVMLAPMWVFIPLAGVQADRHNRRHIVIGANLLMAAVAALMAGLYEVEHGNFWVLIALSFPLGIAGAVALPASQALIPLLTTPARLPTIMAWFAVEYNLARVLGPLLAAWFLHTENLVEGLWFNSATFFAVAALVCLLRPAQQQPVPAVPGQLTEALRSVHTTPRLLYCFVAMAAMSLLLIGITPLMPAIAVSVSDWPAMVGLLNMLLGSGAVAGSLGGAALARRMERRSLIAIAIVVLAGGAIGLALATRAHSPGLACAAVVVFGAAFFTATAVMSGAVASITPDVQRGRIMGLFVLLLAGVAPIGSVILGGLADLFSLWEVLLASAALTLLLTVCSELLPSVRATKIGRAPASKE